ncbi:hypothetical protein [Lysinibacillus piscis]|uniref:Glycogen biosynthesis protein GlgD n=1 Tax=Lysinibacillus piscis TaxID=2518931 RepID=A0ABQ5NL27_9BACI|nr:hypothetical protein [Lysinibacillus sp. KH24]GLC88985.1 hypothetical protein LYSBPC_21120 [Lysinibacillus sp. KH24]
MVEKKSSKKNVREEFGQELSPDDLDTRNKNQMTKEQKQNTPTEKNTCNKNK